jgi:serine/threonine-protein phosphatase 6 regulatory ankyrin repeat subunit B
VQALAVSFACYANAAQPSAAEEAFFRASGANDTAALLRLIEGAQGFSVRERFSDGETPLGFATKLGQEGIVDRLLARNADPNALDPAGWSPLGIAVLIGRPDIARMLVARGARTDQQLPGGATPASLASATGSATMREALRLGPQSDVGPSQRLLAAIVQDDEEAATRAIAAGARVDAADESGAPLVVLAALNGRVALLRRLLDAGASLNQAGPGGVTPLIAASFAGQVGAIELLLSRNATIDGRTASGLTALDAARRSGVREASVAIERALARTNRDFAARLLTDAAGRGDSPEVNRLLSAGSTSPDGLGAGSTSIPLIAAAFRGHLPIVAKLIEAGANVSVQDAEGNTPVLAAALGGHLEAVRLLMQRGGATGTANKRGLTAATVAMLGSRDDILREVQSQSRLGRENLLLAVQRGEIDALRRHFPIDRNGGGSSGTRQTPDTDLHDGRTLLAIAAAAGHVAVLDLLVARGAAVDGVPRQEISPLGAAAMEGKDDAVRWLLGAGADPLATAAGAQTARQLAARRQRRTTEQLLLAAERNRARELSQFLVSFEQQVTVDDTWNAAKVSAMDALRRDRPQAPTETQSQWIRRLDLEFMRVCNATTANFTVAIALYKSNDSPYGPDARAIGWYEVASGRCIVLGRRKPDERWAIFASRNRIMVHRVASNDPRFCITPDRFDHRGSMLNRQNCLDNTGNYRFVQFQSAPFGENVGSLVIVR